MSQTQTQAEMQRMIDKLCVVIAGEDPGTCVDVLAVFSRALCDRLGVPAEVFVQKFREAVGGAV